LKEDYFIIPFTFISGEFAMKKDTVHLILGDLFLAKNTKNFGTIAVILAGLIVISIGIGVLMKSCKIKK
jgi:hypothetical protein